MNRPESHPGRPARQSLEKTDASKDQHTPLACTEARDQDCPPRTGTPPRTADSVDALLDAARHPNRTVIDGMRTLIARAAPAATESIKWNAPSFATAEHFDTFHLRAKIGVQIVLHLGAKPERGTDMRDVLGSDARLLEWKIPDRAVITVRDAAHLSTVGPRSLASCARGPGTSADLRVDRSITAPKQSCRSVTSSPLDTRFIIGA